MAAPPSSRGADQCAVIDPSPGVTRAEPGGPGEVAGVTAALRTDEREVPMADVATTPKRYAVPFASPDTPVEVAGALPPDPLTVTARLVSAVWPTYGVTVYDLTGRPPSAAGAVQLT